MSDASEPGPPNVVGPVNVGDVAAAYVWGLPLVAMHRTCAAHGGVGRGMVGRDRLATAADRTVVAPNNDTLYASGWFDLRAGDLVVDVGAMDTPDRYWSVMLLDAYTGVRYVCRRLHGSAGIRVQVTYDPGASPAADPPTPPAGRGRVDHDPLDAPPTGAPAMAGGASVAGRVSLMADVPASTADVVKAPAGLLRVAAGSSDGAEPLLGGASPVERVGGPVGAADGAGAVATGGVADGVLAMGTPTVWVLARVLVAGPDDLPAARAVLANITVGQRSRRCPAREAEPRERVAGVRAGFLEELRAALAVDPPAPGHPAAPEGLAALLRDPPTPGVVAAGVERGKRLVARSGGVDRWGNGWGTRSRGADFGDDVAYRAAFAQVSLAGHLPAENRSYTRAYDGSVPAALRFPPGAAPPVDGFWSLCVYGPDLFFASNALDRYSLGDRTPGLWRDPGGGLTLTLGADRPSGAGAANWLPAPAGPCFLTLRAYEGRPPVVDATWFPPDLELLP